jgi:hypothetical protein
MVRTPVFPFSGNAGRWVFGPWCRFLLRRRIGDQRYFLFAFTGEFDMVKPGVFAHGRFNMTGAVRRGRGLSVRIVALAVTAVMVAAAAPASSAQPSAPANHLISPSLSAQLAAVKAEKESRTPAERKIDGQLLYVEKKAAKVPLPAHFPNLQTGIKVDATGQVVVDVRGRMSTALLQNVRAEGGQVALTASKSGSLRVRVPLTNLQGLAASADVTFIAPPSVAQVQTGSVDSEGDTTHRAIPARSAFGVSGAGVKVGVLSDGVKSLALSQSTGDLGAVTVLPGQAGPTTGDEGTAMLEVVHDLAPGAQLYFATATISEAGFAQNIRDLSAAGCRVIIDDVGYFDESTFQDGPLAQAVNDVTAAGVLYFSSAANSGNLDDGTSGVWEGNFTPVTNSDGYVWADFDPSTVIQEEEPLKLVSVDNPATLQWADPAGGSANDYDLYLISADGSTILDSSNNFQTGTQNPFEGLWVPGSSSGGIAGMRLAINLYSGAPRFMDLNLNRGSYAAGSTGLTAFATAGQTYGHSAAVNAFSVAATPAHLAYGPGQPSGPYPSVFSSSNVSETFTSDGPRRMFYASDGTPYTPGNYTSTGGIVRQKPDITAADGVQTTVPGFQPFFGTSAAAPHAGAIAALLLEAHPGLTQGEAHTALTSTATDIQAAGWDRDTGSGIIDAYAAVQYVLSVQTEPTYTALPPARLLDTRSGLGAPTGAVAPSGTVFLQVTGQGGVPASGVAAVVLNVTVAEPTASGFVTVFGDGTTRPTSSNLNYVKGQVVPNLVIAPVGTDGNVDLYNGSPGTTQLVADVSGYFLAGTPTASGAFVSLAPARLLDTRSGLGAPTGAVAPSGTVSLPVAGQGEVPASGVSAVVLNVTVAEPTASGYVTVFGDGRTRPTASNLNFVRGQVVPNLAVAPVGANGKVDLYNGSPGTTQLVADVSGYFLP